MMKSVILMAVLAVSAMACGDPERAQRGVVNVLSADHMRCWKKSGKLFKGSPFVVIELHNSDAAFHRDWTYMFHALAKKHAETQGIVFASLACDANQPWCKAFELHRHHSVVVVSGHWSPSLDGSRSPLPESRYFPKGASHNLDNVEEWLAPFIPRQ